MHEAAPDHPSIEQLEAFSLGRASDQDIAAIEIHVTACAQCCRQMSNSAVTDPLIKELKAAAKPSESAVEETEARRSAVWALRHGLPNRQSGTGSQPPIAAATYVPERIDRYLISRIVGRGGMGVVYEARDERLNRLAAIKMVLAGEFAAPEQVMRFRLEAEIAARLRHPNLVQVYEVGEHQGRPFLALEWVGGGTLREFLLSTKLSSQAAAELVECLAHAVHAAHCQGIVHRDLKPANILLRDPEGAHQPNGDSSTVSSGRRTAPLFPVISDFGLARLVESDSGLTATGVALGTPEYMAPEQAAGNQKNVGPQADVYALGAILYELLAGTPPFGGGTPFETVKKLLETEPPPLPINTSRDLQTIVLKCLQKLPANRYASADDLADDLHRFLVGKPIRARAAGIVERVVKWARRRPGLAGSLAAVVVALVAGTCVSTYFGFTAVKHAHDADLAKEEALESADREVGLRRIADMRVYAAQMAMAHHAWGDSEVRRARELLEACRPAEGQPDLRGWEWHYVNRLCNSELMRLGGYDGPVFAVAFSPDGKLLASAGGGNLYFSTSNGVHPGHVQIRDAQTGRMLHRWTDFGHLVTTLAFNSAGSLLAVGCHDGLVSIFELGSGRRIKHFKPGGEAVTSIALRSDDKEMLIGTGSINAGFGSNELRIWDPETNREKAKLAGGAEPIGFATLSPDGKTVAYGTGKEVVCKLVSTGELIWRSRESMANVANVVFDHAGQRLAVISMDDRVRVLQAPSGRLLLQVFPNCGELHGVAFSPDDRRLVTVGTTPEICLWDVSNGEKAGSIRGPIDIIRAVAFSPDGSRLVTGDHEGFVKIWDASATQRGKLRDVGGYSERNDLHFNQDGSKLFESIGRIWCVDTIDWNTGQFTSKSYDDSSRHTNSSVSSPDGRWLAGVDVANPKDLFLWDTKLSDRPQKLDNVYGFVSTVRFAPNGRFFVASHVEPQKVGVDSAPGWRLAYKLVLWETSSGKPMQVIDAGNLVSSTIRRPRTGNTASVAISPDSNLIAHAGFGERAHIWDRRTGKIVADLGESGGWVRFLTFSEDGRFIAGQQVDKFLTVWNITDWTERCRMQYPKLYPGMELGLAFSPDGRRLASSDMWGVVRLWETDTGLSIFDLRGLASPFGTVNIRPKVTFDVSGYRLASFNNNDTTNLFDATPPPTIVEPTKPD